MPSPKIPGTYFVNCGKRGWSRDSKAAWNEVYFSMRRIYKNISSLEKIYPLFVVEQKNLYKKRKRSKPNFDIIHEYEYELENIFYRAYSYSEKVLQLINAFLDLGLNERDVDMNRILRMSKVARRKNLVKIIHEFQDNSSFKYLLENKRVITHGIKKFPVHIKTVDQMYAYRFAIDRQVTVKEALKERKDQFRHVGRFIKAAIRYNNRIMYNLNNN